MSEHSDPIDRRFRALAEATKEISPTADFDDWIMAAVLREPAVSWFEGIGRSGRTAIIIGALAAAASVLLSVHFENELDDQVLTSFELAELDE